MQIGVETSRSVENKRIFVIDTDDITRAVLQFMLHDENETHELGSVAEALAKGVSWPPDLVLLGRSIVETKGEDVLTQIASAHPAAKILIIEEGGTGEKPPAGTHGVINKPLTVETVRRQVDITLGRIAPAPLVQLKVLG